MKNKKLWLVIGIVSATAISIAVSLTAMSCEEREMPAEQDVETCAARFAEAYFNYDFKQAAQMATPESSRWLSFAASNVCEADVELLNTRGKEATVDVSECNMVDDTTAIATVTVFDYLRMDSLGRAGSIAEEDDYRLTMVRRSKQWLVRMAGPLRSERHSRD